MIIKRWYNIPHSNQKLLLLYFIMVGRNKQIYKDYSFKLLAILKTNIIIIWAYILSHKRIPWPWRSYYGHQHHVSMLLRNRAMRIVVFWGWLFWNSRWWPVTMVMAMGPYAYMNLHLWSYLYANYHVFVKLCMILIICDP